MNELSDWDPRGELVWAERLVAAGNQERWRLQSGRRDIQVSFPVSGMAGVDPSGQMVALVLSKKHGQLTASKPMIIPGIQEKEKALRHFAWVPAGMEAALRDIWCFLKVLRHPELRTFYYCVLTDDDIMQQFYQARASHHHHHDHVGGLFGHSHEVGRTAALLCLQHGLKPLSVYVAFIGGLLHDIGKIHLYYNQQGTTGVCGQHEAFNFMVLAKPLEALCKDSPQVFEALSGCLTAKVGNHNAQYLPESMVRMCDRLSVEVSNWRRVFDNAPQYHWYAKSDHDERIYKRLV